MIAVLTIQYYICRKHFPHEKYKTMWIAATMDSASNKVLFWTEGKKGVKMVIALINESINGSRNRKGGGVVDIRLWW